MIYREDSQPKSKALLPQHFGGNLILLPGTTSESSTP
jgi:hypothetical protein